MSSGEQGEVEGFLGSIKPGDYVVYPSRKFSFICLNLCIVLEDCGKGRAHIRSTRKCYDGSWYEAVTSTTSRVDRLVRVPIADIPEEALDKLHPRDEDE